MKYLPKESQSRVPTLLGQEGIRAVMRNIWPIAERSASQRESADNRAAALKKSCLKLALATLIRAQEPKIKPVNEMNVVA